MSVAPGRSEATDSPLGGQRAKRAWGSFHLRTDDWAPVGLGGLNVELAQILASRGYAVVLPNFRVAPGFGARIARAGKASLGRRMSEDHEDAARWAIDQGFADPARICIAGSSYGGYAVLRALSKTPDLFRCGVAGHAISDVERFLHSAYGDVNYNEYGQAYWREFLIGGDVDAISREISPLHHADKFKAPVLFYAGAKDVRTPIEQTRWMVEALRKHGHTPELIEFRDEAHGFGKTAHQLEVIEKTLAFLDKHIGKAAAK